MGTDKALLPFGGYASLAHYQYERMQKIFATVYIGAKEDKFDFSCKLIADSVNKECFAPSVGFVSLFEHLQAAERVFVLSVDAPFVDRSVIERLFAEDSDSLDAVIAQDASGAHPMCGIYHRSLLPHFRQMVQTDDHRLGKLLRTVRTKFVPFSDATLFVNVNDPKEYAEAKSIAKESF